VASTVYVHPFETASAQQRALTEMAIDGEADASQAVVVPRAPRVSHRYLVVTTICDAFLINSSSAPRVAANAVVIPEDHPYEWQPFATASAAAAEYEIHAEAAARGMVSLGEGSILVYWTKAAR
jgi:hypothetical protein